MRLASRRQGLLLQMILALKQVCNHPAHYLKQGAADPDESGKAQRLLDLLEEMTVGAGETWVGQLPPDELRALFRLEPR